MNASERTLALLIELAEGWEISLSKTTDGVFSMTITQDTYGHSAHTYRGRDFNRVVGAAYGGQREGWVE